MVEGVGYPAAAQNPTRTDEEQALPTNNKHSGEHCLLMINEMSMELRGRKTAQPT